jgi:lactoylglutathione lyase
MKLRLDHIALLVRDLEESAAFYTAIPGIREVPNPMGGKDFRWFEFGPNQRFHMQAGDISRTRVEKNTHFALSAEGDFDTVLADMKGTPGAVNVRPDGMRAIFIQDPNGYWIEINDFR